MRALRLLFRFLLRVQGAIVVGGEIDKQADRFVIHVRRHGNAKPRCPRCDRVMGGGVRWTTHEWRHFDLLRVRCYLRASIRQARCPRHGRMVESVPWAEGRSRPTSLFDEPVTRLVQVADKTAASRMFDISWRTVSRMVTRVVRTHLPENVLDGLEAISIDETSYKRRHRYLTLVTDGVTGRVVWAGEGKSAETLGRFFDELGAHRTQKLRVICMDMSGPYKAAIEDRVPHVDIVYDRYHVVKLLLDAVDEVRRDECRKTGGIAGHPLKKTRFTFLRNPKHRTPKDASTIALVQKTNHRLFRAYELRVSFEDFWACKTPEEATAFLKRWSRSALLSRMQPLRKLARTLREHQHGILGFFRHRGFTNALAEGINSKIQLAIHQARGLHSVHALIAMIHLRCGKICIPA